MCGIGGFWEKPQKSSVELKQICRDMAMSMNRRGPDAHSDWQDPSEGIGLAHARLSIIDLSDAGAQPMVSHSGRYVLVYNGEVYNSDEIRQELGLSGGQFRGHSDTEVILEAFAMWGVSATVRKLIGFFAFALWDREDKTLTLGRDRLGIKPLYWAHVSGRIIFGSVLKCLQSHPQCPKTVNRNSISGLLRHNYIGAPQSIYHEISKLEPGTLLTFSPNGHMKKEVFWSLEQVVRQAKSDPFVGSPEEAVDLLHDLLMDAVGKRMISDVPLGAFLSGGIDSSTVVALMQAQSSKPVRTFSIGFPETQFNEAQYAGEIARHLGTEHTELYVTPEQARDIIPSLPDFFDEPFSDSSQIPTYLISKLTREHVTVALSGDGGDELFAGYTRYFIAAKLGKLLFDQPKLLTNAYRKAIHSLSPRTWDAVSKAIPSKYRPRQLGNRLYKMAGFLGGDRNMMYRSLISHHDSPDDVVLGGTEPKGAVWDDSIEKWLPNFVERMQYLDTITYLPDDILTKVDRASMAASLEARVPLLDHRVVELAWRFPLDLKIRDGQGKWILKQVLHQYVPAHFVDRPKMGFGAPIGSWLRGPLKEWADDLLNPKILEDSGYFSPSFVQTLWQEHKSGQADWQYLLWDILMFEAWRRENA